MSEGLGHGVAVPLASPTQTHKANSITAISADKSTVNSDEKNSKATDSQNGSSSPILDSASVASDYYAALAARTSIAQQLPPTSASEAAAKSTDTTSASATHSQTVSLASFTPTAAALTQQPTSTELDSAKLERHESKLSIQINDSLAAPDSITAPSSTSSVSAAASAGFISPPISISDREPLSSNTPKSDLISARADSNFQLSSLMSNSSSVSSTSPPVLHEIEPAANTSSSSSSSSLSWRLSWYLGIRHRNRYQRENFSSVFSAYSKLLSASTAQRQRIAALEQELAILRGYHGSSINLSAVTPGGNEERFATNASGTSTTPSGVSSPSSIGTTLDTSSSASPGPLSSPLLGTSSLNASSSALRSSLSTLTRLALEEKVLKLQEELTNIFRLQSENSGSMLRLKENAEKDEKTLLAKDDEIAEKNRQIQTLKEEKEKDQIRSRSMEQSIELLRKELESARLTIREQETKLAALQKENNMYLEQLLKLKEKAVVDLNRSNEQNSKLVAIQKLIGEHRDLGGLSNTAFAQIASVINNTSAATPAALINAASVASANVKDDVKSESKVPAPTTIGAGGGGSYSGSASGSAVSHMHEIDLSSSASVIDQVTWAQAVSVVVPTERKRTIRGHRAQLTCGRYSSNGNYFASADTSGVVKLWEARTGAARASLRFSKESIMSIGWSRDDNLLIAAGNDQTARIYNFKASRLEHTLVGHTNRIYGAIIDGDNAITAAYDRTLKLWNLAQGGACTKTVSCSSSCNYLSESPTLGMLGTAHLDSHIRLWSLRTGELMKDLSDLHVQQTTAIEFSKDGQYAVSMSRDNSIKIFDLRTFKILQSLEGSSKEPFRNAVNWNRAAWSHDGQFITAGANSGCLYVWRAANGKLEACLPAAHWPIDPNTGLQIPPGKESSAGVAVTASATVERSASFSSAASSSSSSSSRDNTIPEYAMVCVDWNRNGRQLIACDFGGALYVYGEIAAQT